MEGIESTYNIFDACTIINFLHIDEDDFLLKKLKSKNVNICSKVFNETYKNVFNKFKSISFHQNKDTNQKINEIDFKLAFFRERIYYPEHYLELKEEVAKKTNYFKENGEFISVLLSFYLSKYEEAIVTFNTDDIPAKEHFNPFFKSEDLGSINDSIDLLLLLFENNKDFSTNDLKKYFSSLFSEYAFAISGLQKEINEFQIPKNLIRNRQFRKIMDSILVSLKNLEIKDLIGQYNTVAENKTEYRALFNVLVKYKYFFNQKISNEYLDKLKFHLNSINN